MFLCTGHDKDAQYSSDRVIKYNFPRDFPAWSLGQLIFN